jgi:hypothetical protein
MLFITFAHYLACKLRQMKYKIIPVGSTMMQVLGIKNPKISHIVGSISGESVLAKEHSFTLNE